MTRRVLQFFGIALLFVVLLSYAASAQDSIFTLIDLPALGGASGRLITLVGIANDGTLAGDDQSQNGLGSRLSPALVVTPVTCAPELFARNPFASRAGPEVVGMNNALTVVGTEEGIGVQVGFTQTLAGDCAFFQAPGSVGTLFTGVDDLGRVVGQYWTAPTAEPGLLRFHGFVKDGATFTLLTDGVANDVLWPTRINAAGDIIGYAFRDVRPDNSYTYQAFYQRGGVFTWVDGPAGEDVTLTGLNNAGQATAVLHAFGVLGGPAWLYDSITGAWTMLPLPTPDTIAVLPTAINDFGAFVGLADVFVFTPPLGQSILHQFLAVPVPSAVVEVPGLEADEDSPIPRWRRFPRKARQHIRERLRDALHEQRGHRWSVEAHERHWRPVLDEDGSVCLTDGVRVVGRRHDRRD